MSREHEHYMQMALDLAENGRFSVSPNPMVGCVVVQDNVVIAKAYHHKAGENHAERLALTALSTAKGATAYVTLEPCNHFGKTPPCAPLLVEKGIKEVYIATLDPNPLVSGKGVAFLREHGVTVHIGLLEKEAQQQNRIFFHYIKNKTPFVIAKWAMSLDGQTIVANQDERQLSGHLSQVETHRLRHEVDAILIGSRTAIKDNPLLTVRHQTNPIARNPVRIILTGNQTLPFELALFNQTMPGETWIIVSKDIDQQWHKEAVNRGLKIIECKTDQEGKIALPSLMQYLGSQQITSLLVEGGMTILQSFFSEKLINEYRLFLTPYIISGLTKKSLLNIKAFENKGSDYYFIAEEQKNV